MIKTNIIKPDEIIEFILEGESVLQEVLDTIRAHYGQFSTGVIWNFTHGSNINLSANDMVQIAKCVKEHASHNRTAYIGPNDLEFGLLRMYESYARFEDVAPLIKVFRTRDEALAWISSSTPESHE